MLGIQLDDAYGDKVKALAGFEDTKYVEVIRRALDHYIEHRIGQDSFDQWNFRRLLRQVGINRDLGV